MEFDKLKVISAICPYCSVGCSIDFYTDGFNIMWVRGSMGSYINRGSLCPKGVVSHKIVSSDRRILRPMIRTGEKPPPEEILSASSWEELYSIINRYPPMWKPISWEEASEYIAEKISKILSEWRSRSGYPRRDDGFYYIGKDNPVQLMGSSVLFNEEAYLVKASHIYWNL